MISKEIAYLCGWILFVIIAILFFTLKIEWLGYLFLIGIAVLLLTYIKYFIIKEDKSVDEFDDYNNKREPVDDWDKKKESED